MAILRSLLVNLGLNSAQYRSDLKKTKNESRKTLDEMQKDFGSWKGVVVSSFLAASVAAAKAKIAMVRDQANIASVANMNINDYQAMSFAAQQYGVTAEQIGDISKDTLEKIGEYINAGSGGLQDFADAMNMSKKETLDWAKSVQGLSGQQILQKMVTEMEQAGLSSEQMSNALESLGSDATRLIPLLKNNGRELDRLTTKYESFNKELSPEQIERYRMAAEDIDILTTSLQNMTNLALVPVLEKIYETGRAWQWLMASFEEGTVENITSEMANLREENKSLEAAITRLNERGFDNFFADDAEMAQKHADKIAENTKRYNELKQKLIEVQGLGLPDQLTKPVEVEVKPVVKKTTKFETEIADAPTFHEMYGGTDTVDTYMLNQAKIADAMAERLIESGRSLEDQYEIERAFLEKNLTDYDTYLQAKAVLDQKYTEAKTQEEAKVQQVLFDAQQQNLATLQQGFSGLAQYAEEGSALAKAAFLASQAVAAAQIFVSAEQAKWVAASTIPNAAAQAAAMASIDAQKYVSLALVAAQTGAGLAGMAHDGIDNVPSEGTWLLDKGERVVDSRTNGDLKQFLASGAGRAQPVNVTVDLRGTTGDKELDRKLRNSATAAYNMVMNDARSNGPVYKAMKK